MFLTIPTLLTWARIAAIPLIVGVFYLPLDERTCNLIATVLFVVFALTDWLDGWLARKLNQTSAFGAFLDPVADKILVCAALLVLVKFGRVDVLIALVIIGREIAISSLREWMAQIGASRSVAVHMLGKFKTATQMTAIPFLLYDGMLFGVIDTRVWGTALTITDPTHVVAAARLREVFQNPRAGAAGTDNDKAVVLRNLADYDEAFGVDLSTGTEPVSDPDADSVIDPVIEVAS